MLSVPGQSGMNKEELRRLWAESLGSPTSDGLDRLAQAVVDLYASGDYRRHLAEVHTRRAIKAALASAK